MRPHDPEDGFPRRWYRQPAPGSRRRGRNVHGTRHRPVVETLEARDLPSTLASVHQPPRSATTNVQEESRSVLLELQARAAEQRAQPDSPNGLLGKQPAGRFLDPKVIQKYVNLLYGPNSATPMNPTPAEVKRQTFTARWSGQYTVGPPRFSDRASTIHVWSKDGGSNAFFIGKLDMALFPTADPGATPTPGDPFANQLTGTASLFPQNLLQTGGILLLDVNGTPSPGSDPLALPTQLTWTYDSNNSGGNFAAPAGFTQGAGTLDIQWIPDAHPHPGSMGSGKVIVTFQGLINYSQINSAVSKFVM
jgi:hypothetical protein